MLSRFFFQSKFVVALLAIIGAMTFARVSVDRAEIDELMIVGNLSEAQLQSVRASLDALEPTISNSQSVQSSLTDLNWVNKVNVRKRWPAAMSVEVVPEVIIAYWNDDGFITEGGKVIVTDLLVSGDLPLLYGPEGAELEVMHQYQQLNRTLNAHGHDIRLLARSERGAWSFITRDRIRVLLGKDDLKARMQRFLKVTGEIGGEKQIAQIDARYTNGVAVQFLENDQLDLAEITQRVGEQSL